MVAFPCEVGQVGDDHVRDPVSAHAPGDHDDQAQAEERDGGDALAQGEGQGCERRYGQHVDDQVGAYVAQRLSKVEQPFVDLAVDGLGRVLEEPVARDWRALGPEQGDGGEPDGRYEGQGRKRQASEPGLLRRDAQVRK